MVGGRDNDPAKKRNYYRHVLHVCLFTLFRFCDDISIRARASNRSILLKNEEKVKLITMYYVK